jgi:hypothetical protein
MSGYFNKGVYLQRLLTKAREDDQPLRICVRVIGEDMAHELELLQIHVDFILCRVWASSDDHVLMLPFSAITTIAHEVKTDA